MKTPAPTLLRRAAIYTRFSSDKQSDASCEDQAHLCRALAEQEGMVVTAEYHDRAVSGASTVNRMELRRLMLHASEKRFDVILCEHTDRLSRDLADVAKLKRDLTFLGIPIVTLADGEVGTIQIGLRGMMSELFLADLAQRTRRGLAGRIRAGASAGGRSYGYRVDPTEKGALTIDEIEAATVRRIFASFLAGDNARTIAAALNHERVPGPQGGPWNASTISGSKTRQNGILQNRLYVGERVWNRQRFIKDPATGKRVSRPNAESQWQRAEVPELAIVPRETFAAVRRLRLAKGQVHSSYHRRPRHLLSGLLFCGCCGAGYTVVGSGRIGCAGYRERGDCTNNRTITLKHVEERVLAALHRDLASPERVAHYVRQFREQQRARIAAGQGKRSIAQARLRELSGAIGRTVDLLVSGKAPSALMDRLREMEAEKLDLEASLSGASADTGAVELHPQAAEVYRRIVEDLQGYLNRLRPGEPADRLVAAVRAMIDKVVVHPTESQKPVGLEVHGLLAQLLVASTDTGTPLMGVLVAGTRYPQYPILKMSA